jgi:hypothetical protein
MAQHWSAFVCVSYKQACALDKMAAANGFGDEGMALLMEVGKCSRSKVQKSDYPTIQRWVDRCFELYGR